MATLQRMTFDDLMATPDDGYLYELVRGEIMRMPPPKEDHGDIEAALVAAIGRYLYDPGARTRLAKKPAGRTQQTRGPVGERRDGRAL